jgi:hypothetical protein
MASITTRAGKGSPLTNAEVDANFVNLNTDKLEATTTATLTNKTINIANNTLTGVQPTLVSGTSIKTINSQSLLGSGNIALAASPGGSTTQVQFNNAGVFAGSSAFTFSGTSITVNSVTLGRGAGVVNSNSTAVGASALAVNDTGDYNTAYGFQALAANTTGNFNSAFGMRALADNIGGRDNTAGGFQALAANTTGDYNTAFGSNTISGGSVGSYNASFGSGALATCEGSNNSAFGASALNSVISGSNNSAFGHRALINNSFGSGNTAISPMTNTGTYSPVFDPTSQNNRFCMGATTVTNAYIQVAWTVVSDARDKTDFAPVSHGLDFVSKLKPTAYRYKMTRESEDGHGPLRYGFKAQDVLALEGSNPVIVDAEDPEKLRFNDQSMIAVLVKAIQELKQQFDDYKASHP